MKRAWVSTLLVFAFACAGCERDCFEIEIVPEGKEFQRKLTCWHEEGMGEPEGWTKSALPKPELGRLAGLYESRQTPDDAVKQTFVGRFTGATPADVGGAGSLTFFGSPFGSCSVYVERFRGNDDLEAELAKRRRVADQLTDLILGWLKAELGTEPGFKELHRFVDREFRRDLKNLGMYAWSADVAARYRTETGQEFLTETGQEFIVRACQYLVERGYFTRKDIPALVRSVSCDQGGSALKLFQRLVARKMGVADSEPIPKRLALLGDGKLLGASWTKYVEGTELFKARLAEWERQRKSNPDAERPTDATVLTELVADTLFKFELVVCRDTLKLRLVCRAKPFSTNGKWDEQAGAVTWSTTLAEHPSLPVVCFASWSQPNADAQTNRFGSVLLTGKSLAEYVIWYRALDDLERATWDEFIAGLRPGAALKPAVESFRFPGDPKPDPAKPDKKPDSLADTPRGLILEALEPDEDY